MKTTYVATAPDGTEATRTSARAYTHAIAIRTTHSWNNPEPHWGFVGFRGRADLAEAEARRWPVGLELGDGGKILDVQVVPAIAKGA